MSGQWHGGKGSTPRTASRVISKEEYELRDALWRAPESEKPAIRDKLKSLQEQTK